MGGETGLEPRMRLSRARRAASSCARSERNVLAVLVADVDTFAEPTSFVGAEESEVEDSG